MSHHRRASDLIAALRRGAPVRVDFVSPIVSTMLAAERLHTASDLLVTFDPDPQRYAENSGLVDALAGRPPSRAGAGLAGKTFSPLAKLGC